MNSTCMWKNCKCCSLIAVRISTATNFWAITCTAWSIFQIRKFGYLHTFSAFPFESHLKILKKLQGKHDKLLPQNRKLHQKSNLFDSPLPLSRLVFFQGNKWSQLNFGLNILKQTTQQLHGQPKFIFLWDLAKKNLQKRRMKRRMKKERIFGEPKEHLFVKQPDIQWYLAAA